MECSITQMSNNRARLISRDKNSRPGIEKALISKSMKKDARLWTSFSFTLRRVRDSNPRFSYKPFWCCFLLLNSGLIFQIFAFVHTGFTRCLHDFSPLEKLCKVTKNY